MIIKTTELSGLALDYAVAMCEYPHLVYGDTIGLHHASHQLTIPAFKVPDCFYNPSVNWSVGGVIVERERITLDARESDWQARIWDDSIVDFIEVGKRGPYCNTALIAAMRCYVTSKLGNEVEIPDELV
jgi:hypothetical protein